MTTTITQAYPAPPEPGPRMTLTPELRDALEALIAHEDGLPVPSLPDYMLAWDNKARAACDAYRAAKETSGG
jgi:hypothetical protein